jgi:two-component system nitrogen regulation response regulator GlnG
LFHRLNVIRLRLPPLRERGEDVPLLARHFLSRSARDLGVEAKRLSEEALARLCAFSWPGNVRQLENVCHWLTVMAPAQVVEAKDLPPEIQPMSGAAVPVKPWATPFEQASSGLVTDSPALTAGTMLAVGGAESSSLATSAMAASWAAPATLGGLGEVPAIVDAPSRWASLLETEVSKLLAAQSARGEPAPESSDLMDQLTRTFESTVIRSALRHTRGRRIDAALRLGIGRNTITRKIQDLGLEDDA